MKTNSTEPELSVVICAYNAAPYIADTLQSVLSQTYQNFEIIVVNDGSTDETEEALEPFRAHLIYLSQRNAGPAAARNTALKQARGRYIALLDSDDQWLPEYLEKMLARMEAEPEIDVLYPNAILFGVPRWEGKLFQDVCPSQEPVTFEKLINRECNVFISALFKREILAQVGLFDEDLCGSEDLDLWLRMMEQGYHFAFTREPLVRYRKRADSLSSGSVKFFENVRQAYRKLQNSPTINAAQSQLIAAEISKIETEIHLRQAKLNIYSRDFFGAARHLLEVHCQRPSLKLKMVLTSLILMPELLFWFVTKGTANDSIGTIQAQTAQIPVFREPEPKRLPYLVTKPTNE